MPRGVRKALLNPQKSQLRFVEQPRIGARHDYGVQLRSAINPKSFVSVQSRQDVTGSWISPQFTSFEGLEVRRYGRGRKKNHSHTRTLNSTSFSSLPRVRRTTVCKYPTLLFDTSNSVPQRNCKNLKETRIASCPGDFQRDTETALTDKFDELPVQTSKTRRSETIPADPDYIEVRRTLASSTPHEPQISHDPGPPKGSFTPESVCPPHIETPTMPSCSDAPSSSVFCLLFSPNQPKTPPRTKNPLVKDTPERDYGLKVTWRRRKDLMKLLTERGRMLLSEATVTL